MKTLQITKFYGNSTWRIESLSPESKVKDSDKEEKLDENFGEVGQ